MLGRMSYVKNLPLALTMFHELMKLDSRYKLHIVGGGSQNEILNQMTADLCGITIETGPIEGTAIGNLLVQLIANGELADINEARLLVKGSFPTTIYEPESS